MTIYLPDRIVDILTVQKRDEEIRSYDHEQLESFIALSEKYSCSGILLFQSNSGNIDPWVFAQVVMSTSSSLCPFIAVNPVYMHPLSAAQKILSLSSYYKRKIYINYIIGTSKSDLASINDNLDHEERYERLTEYIKIVTGLLRSDVLLSFSGKYFIVQNLRLPARLPGEMLPEIFVAGSSENARRVRGMFNAISLQMAKGTDGLQERDLLEPEKKGLHFGVITRETGTEAIKRFSELFTVSEEGQALLNYSLLNTDARWKRQMFSGMEEGGQSDNTYSMAAFANFKSDCPYHVGSYREIAEAVVKYVINGVSTIVIEIPGDGIEFEHISRAFNLAKKMLLENYYVEPKFSDYESRENIS
jgi:alkanesulfonate monooxygenase